MPIIEVMIDTQRGSGGPGLFNLFAANPIMNAENRTWTKNKTALESNVKQQDFQLSDDCIVSFSPFNSREGPCSSFFSEVICWFFSQ